MGDTSAEDMRPKLPSAYAKVDHGYRDSKHYLTEQLRYSDSVIEFRSIKQAILHSMQFSIAQRNFQFAKVTVEASHNT